MHAVRALAAALVAAWLLSAPAARADQNDARLPALFEQLKTTRSAADAAAVQATIWAVWMESADAEVNLLMLEGVDAMKQGELPRALEVFDKMVGQAPKFAEGWNKRATVEFLMDDYKASVADIEKTLALEPHHWGALSGLGQIYLALDDDEAALRAFKKALEINPHLDQVKAAVQELEAKLEKHRI
ncbi:MAG TPA: tetratricopeptide repeat protein [Candidatus Sulfotelmatobacter sp.]|nr:tetratricopeptide repeat protein [Candidatus Sulfotelmatobacter sp.]